MASGLHDVGYMEKRFVFAAAMSTLVLVSFIHGCGSNNSDSPPAQSTTPVSPDMPVASPNATTNTTGDFNFSCGSSTSNQQQQSHFNPQQSCQENPGPKQPLHFPQMGISDFDVRLDCDNRRVFIKNNGIDSSPQQSLPIQDDGTVSGSLRFNHQLDDDGKGHQSCFVLVIVSFDGRAVCPVLGPETQSLALSTEVTFQNTNADNLAAAGITPDSVPQNRSRAPSPSPFPSESPSPHPSMSPSPHPTPSFSVQPVPIIVITPIPICVIENPCPLTGDINLTC